MTSKSVIKFYARAAYWLTGLERATACWRAEEAGIEYTEDERKILFEASNLLYEAEQKFRGVFSSRIGRLITSEVKSRGGR